MRVFWSTLALERVSEEAEHIARDSAEAAEKWIDDIFASVERLEMFPESGRMVPELNRRDVREVLHKRYRVIYKIKENRIEILTVRHMRQLLDPDEWEQ